MSKACARCGHPENEHSGGGDQPCIGGKLFDDGCTCAGFVRTCSGCGHPEDEHTGGDGCTRQLPDGGPYRSAPQVDTCPCALFLPPHEMLIIEMPPRHAMSSHVADAMARFTPIVVTDIAPAPPRMYHKTCGSEVGVKASGVAWCPKCEVTTERLMAEHAEYFVQTKPSGTHDSHWAVRCSRPTLRDAIISAVDLNLVNNEARVTRLGYVLWQHDAQNMVLKRVGCCARCGDDHEGPIFAMRLTQPFAPVEANGTEWTHWFPCPTNGQPILVRSE